MKEIEHRKQEIDQTQAKYGQIKNKLETEVQDERQ